MSPTLHYRKNMAKKVSHIVLNRNNGINNTNNELMVSNGRDVIFDLMPILQPILDFDDSDDYMDEMDGNVASNDTSVSNANQGVRASHPTDGKSHKKRVNRGASAMVSARGPTFLFIESLIWIFCGYHESDKQQQRLLYYKMCQHFHKINLIGDTFQNESLHQFREVVCQAFNQLVHHLKSGLNPLPLSLSNPNDDSSQLIQTSSHFEKEFIDLGLIEKGGFGIVKKAKYRFDGCEYAVKMIRFQFKSATDFNKIIREVHLYANLSSHPNVVGYKTAWIEKWSLRSPKTSISKHMKTTASHTTSQQMNSLDEDINIVTDVIENDVSIRFEETSNSGLRIESSIRTVETNQTKQIDNKLSESETEMSDEDEDDMSSDSTEEFSFDSTSYRTTRRQTVVKRKKTQSKSSTNNGLPLDLTNGCNGHKSDNIPEIKVEDYGTILGPQLGAVLYIQMELCSLNLKSWLRDRNDSAFKRFQQFDDKTKEINYILSEEDIKTAKNIFRQILKGVEYIHSQHLIHRDLKPQNILFSIDGSVVKIGDFGLATLHNSIDNEEISVNYKNMDTTAVDGDNNEHTGGIGTSIYAAPEQKVRHSVRSYDQKTDLFSLGIILFELFYPLSTDMEKANCVSNITKRRQLPKTLTIFYSNVEKVILSLTHPNPALRPNATQVLHNSSLFLNEEQLIIKHLEKQNQQLICEMTAKDNRIRDLENQLIANNKEMLAKDLMIESLTKQLDKLSNKMKFFT